MQKSPDKDELSLAWDERIIELAEENGVEAYIPLVLRDPTTGVKAMSKYLFLDTFSAGNISLLQILSARYV